MKTGKRPRPRQRKHYIHINQSKEEGEGRVDGKTPVKHLDNACYATLYSTVYFVSAFFLKPSYTVKTILRLDTTYIAMCSKFRTSDLRIVRFVLFVLITFFAELLPFLRRHSCSWFVVDNMPLGRASPSYHSCTAPLNIRFHHTSYDLVFWCTYLSRRSSISRSPFGFTRVYSSAMGPCSCRRQIERPGDGLGLETPDAFAQFSQALAHLFSEHAAPYGGPRP